MSDATLSTVRNAARLLKAFLTREEELGVAELVCIVRENQGRPIDSLTTEAHHRNTGPCANPGQVIEQRRLAVLAGCHHRKSHRAELVVGDLLTQLPGRLVQDRLSGDGAVLVH